jgi:hypothetical protein
VTDFITVYNLSESGYRGIGWFLSLGTLLIAVLVYLILFKPDSRGERIYRISLSLIWLLACIALLVYHYRAYSVYSELVGALRNGDAQQTTGVITYVQVEGYFLYFDLEGQRFRCSRHQWPFRLGFHPGDFLLKPTFLASVYKVDDVVVRLDIHRANLSG